MIPTVYLRWYQMGSAFVKPRSMPGEGANTNLRSEWYNKGNDEGREEDLFWERESHERLLIFQWKKSNVA